MVPGRRSGDRLAYRRGSAGHDGCKGILDFVTGFPGPDGEVLIDDVGLVTAGKLPAADVTWLYNSGQGRTWPINVVSS